MNKLILATIIGTSLLSVSAWSSPNKSEDFINVNYDCANNQTFNAVFINDVENSYAVIGVDGHIIPMKIIEAASGASYKSDTGKENLVLHTKGDKAELVKENGDVVFSSCISTPLD
ncbi:MliC family protein [Providencia rettgeri]|uniref:MliC family protein n=1 Tax=Providencia rettgeri TaxID=587 RepID=UPI002362CCEB|nr:MliC family protein [Providencia rettgeri]